MSLTRLGMSYQSCYFVQKFKKCDLFSGNSASGDIKSSLPPPPAPEAPCPWQWFLFPRRRGGGEKGKKKMTNVRTGWLNYKKIKWLARIWQIIRFKSRHIQAECTFCGKLKHFLNSFGGICFLHVRKIKSGVLLLPPLFPKGGREGPSSASKGKRRKMKKIFFFALFFPH